MKSFFLLLLFYLFILFVLFCLMNASKLYVFVQGGKDNISQEKLELRSQ